MSGGGQAAAAAINAAASLAIAELQRQVEKDKLKLQKEIWRTQKRWAEMYHDLWHDKYRPVEIAFLDYVSKKKPYVPQYDAAESRAVVAVRREFALARQKLAKCIDPRCIGEYCNNSRTLAIEEAKAAVAATNRGFRAEEARKDIKDKEWENLMLAVLQLGRGLAANANGLLTSASQTAQNAASINPYGGYAAAIGNIASLLGNQLVQKKHNGYGLGGTRTTGKNTVTGATGFDFGAGNHTQGFTNTLGG